MPRSLTIVAPEIAPSLARAIADKAARWPQLARLAGQGRVCAIAPHGAPASDLRAWQQGLLAALGLGATSTQYPSAPVTRTGDVNERASGFWMHAMPMHFAAGMDRLTAVMLEGHGAVTDCERAALEDSMREHFTAASCELVRSSEGQWLVHAPRALEVTTAEPALAVRGPLEQMLPRGRDAPELRRLMTELQMILHEHPVNVARADRGAPEVNAIWLHGGGLLEPLPLRALPPAFGDDLYLRGIYRLHGASSAQLPVDAHGLSSQLGAPHAVAVVPCSDLDQLETDWIVPLARALRAGTLTQIDVVLDRWRLVIERRALLRFWKSPRPPAQWVAC